jgi:hypothetical protein
MMRLWSSSPDFGFTGCVDRFFMPSIMREINVAKKGRVLPRAFTFRFGRDGSDRSPKRFRLFDRYTDEREKPTIEDGFITQGCQILIQDWKIVLHSAGLVDHLPSGDISMTDSEIVWKMKAYTDIVKTNGTIRLTDDDVREQIMHLVVEIGR